MADALASLASGLKTQDDELVPYYPNPDYLKKNWAPEKIPVSSLKALAKAQAQAVKAGIISPSLAQKFLANVLTEGYTGGPATVTLDKGVSKADVGEEYDPEDSVSRERTIGRVPFTAPQFGADQLGYDSPDVRRNLQLMGLTAQQIPLGSRDPFTANLIYSPASQYGPAAYTPYNAHDASANAKLAAVILAKKAALYGENNAIQRWNGAGPDSVRHANKVNTLQQMMLHPYNQKLVQLYQKYLQEP